MFAPPLNERNQNYLSPSKRIFEKEKEITEFLDDTSILNLLKERIGKGQQYTFVGNVLVSVNPLTPVDQNSAITQQEAISQEHLEVFSDKSIHEVSPHIFAIAENAFRNLTRERKNQSIVISGVSSSGKSSASHQIMQFIAASQESSLMLKQDIQKTMNDIHIVLGAFGNALTKSNVNSSRYAKFFKIFFDVQFKAVGCEIQQILFERSRVVDPPENERNFHFFYQLTSGSTFAVRQQLKINKTVFRYLPQSNNMKPLISDKKGFKMTIDALQRLKFTETEISEIQRICAAVLWIGQVEFVALNDADIVQLLDEEPVSIISELLSIDPVQLKSSLFSRISTTIRDEKVEQNFSLDDAFRTRDGMAKELYLNLFRWILKKLNDALRSSLSQTVSTIGEDTQFLGVFDVAGFENEKENRFETLLFNFANEKVFSAVQCHTNSKLNQSMEELGLEIDPKVFLKENLQTCNLIGGIKSSRFSSKSQNGILPLIDSHSWLSQCDDESLLADISVKYCSHPCLSLPSAKQDKQAFIISHYAGNVFYKCKDFISKNRNFIWSDIIKVLQGSKSKVISQLFPVGSAKAIENRRPSTIISDFELQLSRLMKAIENSSLHFVFCLRQNQAAGGDFDDQFVLDQMKSTGLSLHSQIARLSYEYQFDAIEFDRKYGPLFADGKMIHGVDYHRGPSKVLVKDEASMFALERLHQKSVDEKAVLLQSVARMFLQRERLKGEGIHLEKVETKEFELLIKSVNVTLIQSVWRRYKAIQERKRLELMQHQRESAAKKLQMFYKQTFKKNAFAVVRTDNLEIYNGKKLRRVQSLGVEFKKVYISDEAFEKTGKIVKSEIMFAQYVTKFNRKLKGTSRILVLTADHLFDISLRSFLGPKVHAKSDVSKITQVSLTTFADDFIAIEHGAYEVLYEVPNKTELIIRLAKLRRRSQDVLQLRLFRRQLEYCVKSGRVTSLSIVKNESVEKAFIQGNSKKTELVVGRFDVASAEFVEMIREHMN